MAKLENAVDKMQERIEKTLYDKYFSMYKIAIDFLKKEDVLLYGGTAINSIFPKKYKFYGEFELPDLDMFSNNARSVANRLVKTYTKYNTKHDDVYIATVKEALHPGTWKVMVNGAPIADISQISKDSYRKLKENSLLGDIGLHVSNKEFLRMTLYILMSQPMDSHRWGKVFERLVSFNKLFPIKFKQVKQLQDDNEIIKDKQTKEIIEYLKTKEYIIFGANDVFMKMALTAKIGMDMKDNHDMCVYILVDDIETRVREILKDLNIENKDLYTCERINPADDFLSEHTYITLNGKRVIGVFSTGNVCLNYIHYKGLRIGTLHTILRMLYSMYFSSYNTIDKDVITGLMNMMVYIQSKSKTTKGILNQFVTECYGDQPMIFTLRKDQFVRMLNQRKKK